MKEDNNCITKLTASLTLGTVYLYLHPLPSFSDALSIPAKSPFSLLFMHCIKTDHPDPARGQGARLPQWVDSKGRGQTF